MQHISSMHHVGYIHKVAKVLTGSAKCLSRTIVIDLLSPWLSLDDIRDLMN